MSWKIEIWMKSHLVTFFHKTQVCLQEIANNDKCWVYILMLVILLGQFKIEIEQQQKNRGSKIQCLVQ